MTRSDVQSFTEPGDFAAAIRGAEVEMCLLVPGLFSAGITRVDLNSLRIQRLSESHPRIMHATLSDNRLVFSFHGGIGADLFYNGTTLMPDSIACLKRRESFFQRSDGPVVWGCMSVPEDIIHSAVPAVAGWDPTAPRTKMVVAAAPGEIAKLRRLHAAVGLLAEKAPEVIEQPEAARGLEQALIETLAECFSTGDSSEDRSTHRRHQKIMRNFHAILQGDAERPLYVLEMAEMMGVSVRSLTACCQEYLGMGPKKYLLLRRMYLARQALHRADPHATNVTDIATQYGFWQLGRFAGDYKSLFGESPSRTLHHECS
jgi:AraC-like DNA-binding protein